jgi:hypothetical protein
VTPAGQFRAYSERYGAREPWLVSPGLAGLYLLWRLVMAALRPVLFLSLAGGSVWFALEAARQLPGTTQGVMNLTERLDAAIHDAVDPDTYRHQAWLTQMQIALQTPRGQIPDIEKAQAIAAGYIPLKGEEVLALELLSEGRSVDQLEARLRAQPAWVRERVINQAIAARLQDGRLQGFDPHELIFAPRSLTTRLARAQALFGSTLAEAELWFVEPDGRALSLDTLPGLTPRTARIYDDVRGLVVHGCAMAARAGTQIGQCRVGFLPKPGGDPVLAGLALAVTGADEEVRTGARLLKAAWAAGLLDEGLAGNIALGPDRDLGEAAVLTSAMLLLVDAGEVWSQPARFESLAVQASGEARRNANITRRDRDRIFAAFTALRRELGALGALRLAETVRSVEDAEQLVRLAQASPDRLLALHALTGSDLFLALDRGSSAPRHPPEFRDWPRKAQQFAGLAALVSVLALSLVFLTLFDGWKQRRGRGPSALEALDGAVTRLILGRNP